ncbi:hemolysin family protein [Chitinophagaceae bacterium LWZ2-11]
MNEILVILGLVILNGVFSMAEIALVSARKARLEAQAKKGDADAKRALALANHPDTFLSTVQIGITLIGILTGIFSGEKIKGQLIIWLQQFDAIKPYSNGIATVIVLLVITYLSLVLGELVPKRIGLSNPERIAKLVAGPMRLISSITFPFIWLLTNSTNVLVKLFGIKANDTQVTEDEIKAIINEGTEQGTIEEAEQAIIERIFHLGDRNITSLMTHRSELEWIDVSDTVGEAKKQLGDVIFSIYPVCKGNMDHIVGIAYLKDLFVASDDTLISTLVKQPVYVPENNSAYQVLEFCKKTKVHQCFIVNEYGDIEGLITLNDIIDAIVGDMPEPDEENFEITHREDGSFLIDGQIPFYDLLKHFNRTEWLEEDQEYDTLAGFILHKLKRIPSTGDKFTWNNYNFEIVDMDNHRIDKVLVIPKK